MKLKSNLLTVLFFLFNFMGFSSEIATSTGDLRCEYLKNPLGIDAKTPRFSWKITSSENNQVQTAYQLLVASSPKLLKPGKADLWDSGKINSDESIQVEYRGKALNSRQKCYWTVKIWDKNKKETRWAPHAGFEMGLLNENDWQSQWIKSAIDFNEYSYPSPLLRKEFNIAKKIKSARLYCTSMGLYEFHLNGQKVGNEYFTPFWTSYKKRLQYQVFDITAMLKPGVNAAGAVLGNGWYRVFNPNSNSSQIIEPLELLAQLEIEYSDGTKQVVVTDNSWKSSTGAILKSEIYNGEIYDARLEKTGWDTAGYNDSEWAATSLTNRVKSNLVATISEPVRKKEEFIPKEILKTPNGETVFDMGQNMVGWCRIKVNCPAGTTIKLRHAEVLDKNGNFYTENLRTAKQEIVYTCKGGSEEIYEPHFTFQGFRYVEITGYPGNPTKEILTGVVANSDLELTSTFSCNSSLLNQLQHNIIWGQKGNFVDVPTDCPQRNERLGWTGDAQVFSPTACYNMNSAAFFTKWLLDLAADQHEDGAVPHVIPNVLGRGGASGWADASCVVPWVVYQSFGDKRVLSSQYESMKKWVEFMRKTSGEPCIFKSKDTQFGDWLAFATTRSDYPGATTDKDFLSTAYFYHSTDLLRQTAEILGKTDDAREYASLQKKIKEAFNREFVSPNGRLTSNTQTGYVVALSFGLLPAEKENIAAARLAADVNQFGHITTGFLGAADICHVLTKYGYVAEAYKLLYRESYPSWLYPVTKGATTIWERWDGIKPDGTFQNAGMNSFNHYAYGAVGNWMYKCVAGINSDPSAPGYKHIIIQPFPGGTMNDVKASHESPFGNIVSEWFIKDNKMNLHVVIPANTTAEILVPSTENSLKMNGETVANTELVKKDGVKYHFLKVKSGSGDYNFETGFGVN